MNAFGAWLTHKRGPWTISHFYDQQKNPPRLHVNKTIIHNFLQTRLEKKNSWCEAFKFRFVIYCVKVLWICVWPDELLSKCGIRWSKEKCIHAKFGMRRICLDRPFVQLKWCGASFWMCLNRGRGHVSFRTHMRDKYKRVTNFPVKMKKKRRVDVLNDMWQMKVSFFVLFVRWSMWIRLPRFIGGWAACVMKGIVVCCHFVGGRTSILEQLVGDRMYFMLRLRQCKLWWRSDWYCSCSLQGSDNTSCTIRGLSDVSDGVRSSATPSSDPFAPKCCQSQIGPSARRLTSLGSGLRKFTNSVYSAWNHDTTRILSHHMSYWFGSLTLPNRCPSGNDSSCAGLFRNPHFKIVRWSEWHYMTKWCDIANLSGFGCVMSMKCQKNVVQMFCSYRRVRFWRRRFWRRRMTIIVEVTVGIRRDDSPGRLLRWRSVSMLVRSGLVQRIRRGIALGLAVRARFALVSHELGDSRSVPLLTEGLRSSQGIPVRTGSHWRDRCSQSCQHRFFPRKRARAQFPIQSHRDICEVSSCMMKSECWRVSIECGRSRIANMTVRTQCRSGDDGNLHLLLLHCANVASLSFVINLKICLMSVWDSGNCMKDFWILLWPAESGRCAHGPRLYVCQAPNAFICVSGLAPPKHQMRLYVCHQMRLYVCHQMRLYVCHQMRLYVCHQMRLYVCHQMCLLTQRSSLRSLTFARFARTFFNSLN